MTTFANQLRALHACSESIAWVGSRTAKQAWADCDNPQWMLWALGRSTFDRRALNECVIEFATIALEAARPMSSAKPCWAAVEAAHRMVVDAIRNGDLVAARRAANAAANAAAADAANDAANAAANAAAADAAFAAAFAAAAAADVAYVAAATAAAFAAAFAADVDDVAAAKSLARAKCCAAIRRHFPCAPVLNMPEVTK